MLRAFRISYALKNTYRVNGIIYSIKQIPILKKFLPESLYSIRWLKIFANVLSAIWEVISTFLGKWLYVLLAVSIAGEWEFYKESDSASLFVHIFFFLTIIGTYMNTYMFNPTNDKYYAIALLRMDAKSYTLSNYFFLLAKVVIGFLPFTILYGLQASVPLWLCILLPFFVMCGKLILAWRMLWKYEKKGIHTNENFPEKIIWVLSGIFLGFAYVFPILDLVIPLEVTSILMAVVILGGIYAGKKISGFTLYREMYQQLLADKRNNVDFSELVKEETRKQQDKVISNDVEIESRKKGFEYFNDLFIKRHKKILWKPARRMALICLVLVLALLIGCGYDKEVCIAVNENLIEILPVFVFLMYMINRGTSFTQSLYFNCDHSMLTYSFYRKPEFILGLFQIRLRELIKINLLPAAVIAAGLPALIYFSGGTANQWNYAAIPIAILAISIFFSVHYLICYYLLQPYSWDTEMKGSGYKIVTWGTYVVCWACIYLRVNAWVFSLIMTVFCLLYCVAACYLVYRFAYKTFRIRN